MKAVLATLVLLAAGPVAYAAWPRHTAAAVPACDAQCAASAAGVAVWRVWNEVDCDDSDVAVGSVSCSDEAQNINHAATVGTLVQQGRFTVVPVSIINGNVPVTWCVRVDDRTWQAVAAPLCPTGTP